MKEKRRVCSLLCHSERKMLTEFAAGSSKADFMISLQPGYRTRSRSDAVLTTPRLLHRQADFQPSRRPRISSFAVAGKSVERIRINVSGKRYELTFNRLFKFPKSLLARSARRANYYDAEKDEFFFDRNRMAFESVYHFYQTAGEFVRPEHIPDNLLMQEMQFFGLVRYISLPGSVSSSVSSPKTAKRSVPNSRHQRMIWELFESPGSNFAARLVNVLMLLVIVLSIIVMCIETLPEFNDADMSPASRNHQQATVNQTYNTRKQLESRNRTETNLSFSTKLKNLSIVEAFCVVCFSLELLIRFIVSPDKLRFFWNVLNIFDLLAVLPFYVTLAISAHSLTALQSAYVLRVLRLTRVFRLVKVYRYSSTVQVFVKTIRECIQDFLMLGFLILMTMIVFASCSYYFEQENERTNFVSIPAACWWAIITMTSVGYGDMVPVTLAGKITGALCVVFGIIIIAPLLPIIASKFSGMQEKAKLERTLALGKQTSNDNSSESSDDESKTSESSEDAVKAVMFAEQQETFDIPKYRERRPTFETAGYRGRPRSITVH